MSRHTTLICFDYIYVYVYYVIFSIFQMPCLQKCCVSKLVDHSPSFFSLNTQKDCRAGRIIAGASNWIGLSHSTRAPTWQSQRQTLREVKHSQIMSSGLIGWTSDRLASGVGNGAYRLAVAFPLELNVRITDQCSSPFLLFYTDLALLSTVRSR